LESSKSKIKNLEIELTDIKLENENIKIIFSQKIKEFKKRSINNNNNNQNDHMIR
jgi:hypothetical protein